MRHARNRGLCSAMPGMTVVEMSVVALVIALVMTGAVLGLGAVTGQRLNQSVMALSAAVRVAYAKAATTGKATRLAIDFESAAFWIEQADSGGRVLLTQDDDEAEVDEEGGERQGSALDALMGQMGSALGQANSLAGILGEDPNQIMQSAQGSFASNLSGGEANMDMIKALGDLGGQQGLDIPVPRYKVPRFSTTGTPHKLESGVAFLSVASEHREHPAEDGRAFVYFFPGGMAELAVIQLQDTRGYVNSIEVHPLTGKCTVHDVPYEMPTNEEDQNEAREGF